MPLKIKRTYVAEGEPFTLGKEYNIYCSNFSPCITLNDEPEKDIKKEVHNLLDKATELIYNNQEELKIDYMDFITLVKIKDEVKK